jgi:transforming growth factor-beta-induced protein
MLAGVHDIVIRRRVWCLAIGVATMLVLLALFVAPSRLSEAQPAPTLGQVIAADPDLTMLEDAIQQANMMDTYDAPGPLTVWGPNNSAFSKLPAAARDRMFSSPDEIREVLTYNMARGRVTAAQVVQVPTVQTVQGESVRISAGDGKVHINATTVVRADVTASNGIMHVIDGVLLPPSRYPPQELPVAGVVEPPLPLHVLVAVGLTATVLGIVLRRSRRVPADN